MTSSDDQRDHIESEATEWLVLQTAGRLDPADARLFEGWLRRSAQHRAVYERMRQTWDALAVLQWAPGDLLRHTADLHAKPRLPSVARRWLAPAFAVAACLLLVIGLAAAWIGNPVTALVADYSTAPGEIRGVTLPDGSRLELGPASAVKLHFSATERRIELLGGSAYFSAVPQAVATGRPFIVDTGMLSARALGTQFLVERLPRGDGVAVVEHAVAVTMQRSDGDPRMAVLSPGQALRYRPGRRSEPDMASMNPLEIAPWRAGNLVFHQVPLQEVVAELNRYRRSRILLTNDDLSARVVSGVFRIGEPDGALRMIAQELGLHVAALPFVSVVYK
ncbi:FecR domain-containing protein [Ferrovibrio sp.]|uniref:FecR family protein n=1 Tax=Ferrovibrio sp. TaxID=1917215 RepID=UPI0026051719|nr:FecR domain-containing protein [Ferrovibrio sp.]